MADQIPGESGNSVSLTTGRTFEIPPLLKTEPIYMEDDIKPVMFIPCSISDASSNVVSSDYGEFWGDIHAWYFNYGLLETGRRYNIFESSLVLYKN